MKIKECQKKVERGDNVLINVIEKIITIIAVCVVNSSDDNHACVTEYHEACHWPQINRNTGFYLASMLLSYINRDVLQRSSTTLDYVLAFLITHENAGIKKQFEQNKPLHEHIKHQ